MEQEKEVKQKKPIWKRWWFWLIAVLFVFILLLSLGGSETSKPSEKYKSTSIEEIKKEAIENLDYEELFRNNSQHVGKIVHYLGKIVQTEEISGNSYILRANITKTEYDFWGNDVFLSYKGERILEDDLIEFWGEVKGVKKYKTVLGASRSIPKIAVLHLKVLKDTEASAIRSSLQQPTVTKIPNLAAIRVSGGSWENWDTDAEDDGPVVEIVYLDNKGEILSDESSRSLKITADVAIYTKDILADKKGRKIFSANFSEDEIILGSIYPKIRIPKEKIDLEPKPEYKYGYVLVTIHTPEQGDFSDEDDLIALYQ